MPNDDDLWHAVAETVKPLNSKKAASKPKTVSLEKKLTLTIKPLRKTPDLDYSTYKDLEAGNIDSLDKKNGQRFRNGEMPIEAVLDLHGHTLESGEAALRKFIHAQNKRKARCLLVITGRGGFLGRGVLKAELPHWINSPEIRSLVLAFAPAKPKDGGDGAFYVLLKRHRKDKE